MNKTICILGLGYTANFLAKKLSRFNFSITGTSRDPKKREHYQKIGYQVVDFNPIDVDKILKLSAHLSMVITMGLGSTKQQCLKIPELEEYYGLKLKQPG